MNICLSHQSKSFFVRSKKGWRRNKIRYKNKTILDIWWHYNSTLSCWKNHQESRTTGVHYNIRAGPTFAVLVWTVSQIYNYLRGRPMCVPNHNLFIIIYTLLVCSYVSNQRQNWSGPNCVWNLTWPQGRFIEHQNWKQNNFFFILKMRQFQKKNLKFKSDFKWSTFRAIDVKAKVIFRNLGAKGS